jgi:hypothetical protein
MLWLNRFAWSWRRLIHRQIGEEGLEFGGTGFARVALLMKEDIALHPEEMNLLGAQGSNV